MKRLLCIVGGMNIGGAETFLMKIYRTIDKSMYQMDFAVSTDGEGAYDDEIKKLGGIIYHITPKSKGWFRNFCDIKNLVKTEKYKYVLRVSQNSLSALELLAAKFGGAKKRAFRSSNSNIGSVSKKQLLIHKLCWFMPRLFANIRIAPSTEAAEFMFGKECVKKGHANILYNGVDLSVYRYDDKKRNQIRQEFNIDKGTILIGHIGRFTEQKNHMFLLEVFKKLHKTDANTKLLLVGEGNLEEKIRSKAKELEIEDLIIFAGKRLDIPDILSAMDVFVMPSLYEGMPNTVIEAQATGLPCVIADTITSEANITGLVHYLPLGKTEVWVEKVLSVIHSSREETYDDFLKNQYDIKSVIEQFTKLIYEA